LAFARLRAFVLLCGCGGLAGAALLLSGGRWSAGLLGSDGTAARAAFAPPTPPPGPPGPRPLPRRLGVTFFDIGQGDSALVRTPGGKFVLIDTGPPAGRAKLFAGLRSAGVNRLDLLVTSHPHQDHFGNSVEALRRLPTAAVVDSGFVTNSPTQLRLLEEVKKHHISFINVGQRNLAGTSTDLGEGVSLRYLARRLPYLTGTDSDPNNNSVVLKVTFGRVSFLFTGDMEEDERARLLASTSAEALRATVLKVAHHGSRNGTVAAFLARVRPEAAVISCEVGNRYGHPHPAALNALRRANVRVFRTDQNGTVTAFTAVRELKPEEAAVIGLLQWRLAREAEELKKAA
jgi:beta-lactamase superfamily II metal-dependent hydrolase